MATDEFESFVQSKSTLAGNNCELLSLSRTETAPDAYWHVMAEHYRVKLEEVTRENQQVEPLKFHRSIATLPPFSFTASLMI